MVPARSTRGARYGSPLGIFLFLLPGLGTYTVLMLYPSLLSLYYSVLNWEGGPIGAAAFVGPTNFRQMLSDPVLPIALTNNARVLFLCWVFQLPLALILASAIFRLGRVGNLYRFLFFLPVIVPTATAMLIWSFVFSGNDYGLLNAVLRAMGLDALVQRWLSADGVVQWVAALPEAWGGIGFFMIIFLAALVGIPQEYYEAAAIDGAGSWRKLIHVTLPSIRGIYVAGMVLALQGALGAYISAWLLTKGGPLHLTETLISYSVYLLWTKRLWGYGSAFAVTSFLLSVLIVPIVWRFAHQREG